MSYLYFGPHESISFPAVQTDYLNVITNASYGTKYAIQMATDARVVSNIYDGRKSTLYTTSDVGHTLGALET